jgi:hypothetical protein
MNYQGVLLDSQGAPVNGTRTFGIKLFDDAIAGTELYAENIGVITVTNGVYSFEFGNAGTSSSRQSESVAVTDGTATTFQKVLSVTNVVSGSVSVSDGTYTWSQSGGSSNEDAFGVAYSTSLRRVTVTYFNGAPTAGRTVTATYRTPTSGISGALAGDNQPWAEITVNGVAQVPRQKVLAVPFAAVSSYAETARTVSSPSFGVLFQSPMGGIATAAPPYNGGAGNPPFTWTMFSTPVYLPAGLTTLRLKLPVSWGGGRGGWIDTTYTMDIKVRIGSTIVTSFKLDGRATGSSPVMSFDVDKALNLAALGVATGLQDLSVEATLSNYIVSYYSPNTGGVDVRLSGGTAQLWLISESQTP